MNNKNNIEFDRIDLLSRISSMDFKLDDEIVLFNENQCVKILKQEFSFNQPGSRQSYSKLSIISNDPVWEKAILLDDDNSFLKFIRIHDSEYLLFSEVLCGGNSVLDLKTGDLYSYSDGTDGFIGTEYLISPDFNFLAVFGCYWAGEYFIRVFDVSNITQLPWPISRDVNLIENGEIKLEWVGKCSLRIHETISTRTIQDIIIGMK